MTEIVNAESFAPHVDEHTRAISMSHVTFHAGHRFDLESVGRLCAERGLYFVVDVMQGIGVTPIDVKAIGATFVGSGTHKGLLVPPRARPSLLEFEAHRIRAGLHGGGRALPRRPATTSPVTTIWRWRRPQDVSRSANFNLPAIQALGAALELIESVGVANIEDHCFELGDHLIEQIRRIGNSLGRSTPAWRSRAAHLRHRSAGGGLARILHPARHPRVSGTRWHSRVDGHVQHESGYRPPHRRHSNSPDVARTQCRLGVGTHSSQAKEGARYV